MLNVFDIKNTKFFNLSSKIFDYNNRFYRYLTAVNYHLFRSGQSIFCIAFSRLFCFKHLTPMPKVCYNRTIEKRRNRNRNGETETQHPTATLHNIISIKEKRKCKKSKKPKQPKKPFR